jgi:hypothetical protein
LQEVEVFTKKWGEARNAECSDDAALRQNLPERVFPYFEYELLYETVFL